MNKKLIITKDKNLISVLEYMDIIDKKVLIICDGIKFVGLISIGDIQRAIINNVNLQELAIDHIRKDIVFAKDTDDLELVKKQMQINKIECMPIVNSDNDLVDIIEWEDLFVDTELQSVNCPVVVMAGGEGKRLRPLTNIIPKPLIPISKKTIIEEIMDSFVKVNCHRFYLSVNYMADKIKDYFEKIDNSDYIIQYINEKKPLGTAGSLFLLKNTIDETFFVTNCDVIMNIDFSKLIDFHKTNNNIATTVSIIKTVEIPYGTIETFEDGSLKELIEKPIKSYQINSGLYVLEPDVFNYIEDNEFLHITTLLLRLKEDNKKVGVFPLSEKSYTDMGTWEMYLKAISRNNQY